MRPYEKTSYEDLCELTQKLLRRLCALTGADYDPLVAAPKPEPSAPKSVQVCYREYEAVTNELGIRNSRRCSQQLTRFLKEAESEAGLSNEMRRWWWNRY